MTLVKRLVKGAPLTFTEQDGNLDHFTDAISALSTRVTGIGYSSLGAGASIIGTKDGDTLRFKSLVAGTNVSITDNGNGTITIASSGGGGWSDGDNQLLVSSAILLPVAGGDFRVQDASFTDLFLVSNTVISLSSVDLIEFYPNDRIYAEIGGNVIDIDADAFTIGNPALQYIANNTIDDRLEIVYGADGYVYISQSVVTVISDSFRVECADDALIIDATQPDSVNINMDTGHFLKLSGLPTSNPGGTGRVWKNGNVLNIT